MSLEDRILEDMKSALKAGRKDELGTIRLLRAQLKEERISKGSDLSEEDVMAVLQKAAKRRRESIDLYRKGNRQDLVDKEEQELALIQNYLPDQISESEINQIITLTIKKLGIISDKNIGKLMGAVMPQVKGKADGKLVQQLARTALANLDR